MDQYTPETRRAHHQIILHAVTETGADLVQMVHAQAKAQAAATPEAPLSHAVKDYDRAARAIRRNIMLSEKLDQQPRGRQAARRQVIRAVEDNIHRHAEPGEAETLHAELLDRLDRPDFEDDLEDRDAEAIITDIVRDFGLAALPGNDPWKRRTPADIETLHARAKPGSSRPRLDQGRGTASPPSVTPPQKTQSAAQPPPEPAPD